MIQLKKKNLIIMILIAALIGGCIGFSVMSVKNGGVVLISKPDYEYYNLLAGRFGKVSSLYDVLDKYYYTELDDEKLVQGMCYGLFYGTGDPYTSYMSKEEYEDLMITATGQLEGIGVTMSVTKDNKIIIISTVKDSPAEKAGLQSGDFILAVDGVEYEGSELDSATAKMRGEPGTKVEIEYEHEGAREKVVLTRAKITMQSVYAEMLGDNIGYIYISSFENQTDEDFAKELRAFEVKGAEGVIIDLRNNGGGIVESGVNVADRLLGEGVLAYTEGKSQEKTYINTKAGKTNLPYVLLINEGTASTAEIVSAGVKDNNGGKIVGVTSFGKGIIQQTAQLKDGDAIKVTVAQYFSPNGTVIQGKGVKPDFEVEIPENSRVDTQLKKAIEVLKEEISK